MIQNNPKAVAWLEKHYRPKPTIGAFLKLLDDWEEFPLGQLHVVSENYYLTEHYEDHWRDWELLYPL